MSIHINLGSWLRGGLLLVAITLLPSLWSQSFTKITSGSIATDVGNSHGCAWADYDNDGNLDLFVPNHGLNNFLYRNNGDGTFTRITTGNIVNDGGNSTLCAWGDFDNDGHPDLFVANAGEKSFLYHNNGDGTFGKITSGAIVNDIGSSYGCAWGDFDRDGYLDLFVANGTGNNFLYRNNGDGTFSKITAGSIVNDGSATGASWGDYDNDGYLDLFLSTGNGLKNSLYHNNGDGTFSKITTGIIVNEPSYSVGSAWGDYDNDGFLDMYVANRLGSNFLYRNNGDGTFTKITSGTIVTDVADANGCSWADYDGDGYLDMFVTNWNGQHNALYKNNGDGTFTKITTGNPVTEGGSSVACGWADFNNDGFLDLFIANIGGQNNFLYRNDGNEKSRISIKGIGTSSNRSAIGAKIKVKATIGGSTRWQTRQISSANGWDGSDLRAYFGLGDASIIETLRIEWPSGIIQEIQNVPVNQILTVTEPFPLAPLITLHPQSQTVGFGANITFSIQATGASPLTYQWRLDGTNIIGATSNALTLNGVGSSDQGDYTVMVTNPNGSVTSHAATLTILTTFTKIALGSIVTDIGNSAACAWGDYDGDGNIDLFVANFGGNNFLYRNNGDATYTKVTTGTIVNDGGKSTGGAWGDYDNDGRLDLFVANADEKSFLYHNNGDGTFTRITSGAIVNDIASSYGCAWGDYDKDGFLDLYVANLSGGGNLLYHNNGDGTFSRIMTGPIVSDSQLSVGCAWGDYDNDGWQDLFVANGGAQNNALYHNNGNGTFSKVTSGDIVNDGGYSVGCSWGDYDNDGYLDLFVANRLGSNFLYHNNANGTFTRITSGAIATDIADSNGCSWGDYDNDGYLDLFVANWNGQNNALYKNNGDATFTKITTGNIVTDGGNSHSCGWGDFNNDGFLDLFVSNLGGEVNFLYANGGNENSRIMVRCLGTGSNRSAIGARIHVHAKIHGEVKSQTRYISSGNGWDGHGLQAHFGLGDATIIEEMFVSWPSGQSQIFHDVPVNDILTVTEPSDPADLSVVSTVTPNPAVQGSIVTYTITVANNGPGTALGVKVTAAPSLGVNFLFAFSSQGSCTGTNPVVCSLGNMAANSSATIVILATTTSGGVHPILYTLENTATVTALSADPNSSNNSATTVSAIRTDSDSDGIPDDFEDENGLNKNSSSDGSIDSDGDGFNNLQEFLLGTSPQNPSNTLDITGTEQVGSDVHIGFNSVAGKTYSAEFCDLYPTVSWTPFAINILGTGGAVQVTDIGGASGSKRFYRIKLVQ